VEGPAGSFVLPERLEDGRIAFIGGGTGIAPLRAMLWQVLETQPATRVAVLESARTSGELAYSRELRQLAAEGRIRLVETITREVPNGWRGDVGRINAEQLAGLIDGPDTRCYVCGPDSLVEEVPVLLADLGVPPAFIETEHWKD